MCSSRVCSHRTLTRAVCSTVLLAWGSRSLPEWEGNPSQYGQRNGGSIRLNVPSRHTALSLEMAMLSKCSHFSPISCLLYVCPSWTSHFFPPWLEKVSVSPSCASPIHSEITKELCHFQKIAALLCLCSLNCCEAFDLTESPLPFHFLRLQYLTCLCSDGQGWFIHQRAAQPSSKASSPSSPCQLLCTQGQWDSPTLEHVSFPYEGKFHRGRPRSQSLEPLTMRIWVSLYETSSSDTFEGNRVVHRRLT